MVLDYKNLGLHLPDDLAEIKEADDSSDQAKKDHDRHENDFQNNGNQADQDEFSYQKHEYKSTYQSDEDIFAG